MSYWRDYPPTHVLVAAYLMGGNKKSSGRHRPGKIGVNEKANAGFNFNDLIREVAFAGGTVTHKLPEIYRLS
jgi:hypothetical protein